MVKRSGFTLIELIFAIVVIAISIVSLPMMTQTTSKGIEKNILQEVVFAAQAVLLDSTTYYWDASSMEDLNISAYTRVVNTGAGDCNATSQKRVGHINRLCLNDNTTTALNALNADALEQAASNYNNSPILIGTASQASYKDSYDATITVNNCGVATCTQFGNEANNSNIKELSITVTQTGDTVPLVVLKAYSANIGAVKIESKVF